MLAARLAEAGVDPAEFTAVLAERCDGVWVYLRYVAATSCGSGCGGPMRSVTCPPGCGTTTPIRSAAGSTTRPGTAALLPLAATLAVAGEPLPAVSLARLAGDLDPVAVRRWCDFTFRPLLTTTRTAAADRRCGTRSTTPASAKYSKHTTDRPPGPDDDQPSEAAALADELAQATVTAHGRIADTYLDCFGGLDTGLPVLAADPGAGDTDGGYPLRHLARHLQHAGRSADLHRLLAAEQPAAGDRMSTCGSPPTTTPTAITSYLDDLARAGSDSAMTTGRALKRRQPAAVARHGDPLRAHGRQHRQPHRQYLLESTGPGHPCWTVVTPPRARPCPPPHRSRAAASTR